MRVIFHAFISVVRLLAFIIYIYIYIFDVTVHICHTTEKQTQFSNKGRGGEDRGCPSFTCPCSRVVVVRGESGEIDDQSHAI